MVGDNIIDRLNDLAELLSEGVNLTDSAKSMGISRGRANKYFATIRKRLGAQAC
jgi:DNA-binding CsgD family transcriptional regulator